MKINERELKKINKNKLKYKPKIKKGNNKK